MDDYEEKEMSEDDDIEYFKQEVGQAPEPGWYPSRLYLVLI